MEAKGREHRPKHQTQARRHRAWICERRVCAGPLALTLAGGSCAMGATRHQPGLTKPPRAEHQSTGREDAAGSGQPGLGVAAPPPLLPRSLGQDAVTWRQQTGAPGNSLVGSTWEEKGTSWVERSQHLFAAGRIH